MTPRRPIIAGIRTGREAGDPEAVAAAEQLREAYSRWASGVTVVAVREGPRVAATTVAAFAPVSLEPALVVASVGRNATVLPLLEPGARFAVSIIAEGQRRLASLFSDAAPLERTLFSADGEPVLEGALCALACTVGERHPAGDHELVLAVVDRVVSLSDEDPLVYFRREYRSLG